MPSPPSGPLHGRVAILGGGAVGGFVAAGLAQAGHQVVLIDAWPENVACIQAEGLTLETPEGTITARPQAWRLSAAMRACVGALIHDIEAGRLRIDPANLEGIQAR